MKSHFYILFCFSCLLIACSSRESSNALFTKLNKSHTGINFRNDVTITEEFNPYIFKSFFNGGGVAIGDINNDGLEDIYFTGNQVANKLYLNLGELKFKDISEESGTSPNGVWSTGATFVDINGDGFLDLYVCKSGAPDTPNRANEFYINQGDLTFEPMADQMGLAFEGLSTHATFLDYDRDGDLDIYLLNNSLRSVGQYDIRPGLREVLDTLGGNRLLRNDFIESGNLTFIDVTEAAGIYGSDIGFGLGVTSADLNGDSWPDLYVSNDFFEKDYLYLNNKNGTFSEVSDDCIVEMEMGAMGADIADFNNDGRNDIFVTEMLPTTLERYKSKANFETVPKHNKNKENGYHNQFGRNVLQVNTGNVNGLPQFQEIGRLAGVEASEWSWGALIQDFDNDGRKDLFIANGIGKDLLDKDYINFFNPHMIKKMIDEGGPVMTKLFDAMPSKKIKNHLYLNQGGYQFDLASNVSGLSEETFTNGSAYSDLDNDGDLDLVINNLNEDAFIYKNQSNAHYLNIDLDYRNGNKEGIGAKIDLYAGSEIISNTIIGSRGFQSSVSARCHFGLGNYDIDSMSITWPQGEVTMHYDMPMDTFINIVFEHTAPTTPYLDAEVIAATVMNKIGSVQSYVHVENLYSDFDAEPSMLSAISNRGPVGAVLDINGDGVEDFIVGGSKDRSAEVYITQSNGSYKKSKQKALEQSSGSEDADIFVVDIDSDGDDDIIIASGSSEFSGASSQLFNRLYINQDGILESSNLLDVQFESTAAIAMVDMNDDGKEDLLFANRQQIGAYGIPVGIQVLLSDNGRYVVDKRASDKFQGLGMITDLKIADLDSNGDQEVIVSTEYGVIHVLSIINGDVVNHTANYGLSGHYGKWNGLEIADMDGDGHLDIVALNIGLNNRFRRLASDSLFLFVNDFDSNGSVEMILCAHEDGRYIPIQQRDDVMTQLPILKRKFLKYADYAVASLDQMFSEEILGRSIVHKIATWESGIFYGSSDGFEFIPLPQEAQFSELYAVEIADVNRDNNLDLILGGNQVDVKPEYGGHGASYGSLVINNGLRNMEHLEHEISGFYEKGQIRDILKVGDRLLILKNSEPISIYNLN